MMRRSSLISSGQYLRTFHQKAKEQTFFSSAHGTFSRIEHILGHKSNLSKIKKIEIISSISSNHNTMRLGINYKKKNCNKTRTEKGEVTIDNSEIQRIIRDYHEHWQSQPLPLTLDMGQLLSATLVHHHSHVQGKTNPSKMVGATRGHQRADTLKP